MSNVTEFPQPQYFGNKEKLLDWIVSFLPREAESCFDGFSGSSIVGYTLKRKGFRVISNDILSSCYQTAKALVENNDTALSAKDIEDLVKENKHRDDFIERQFSDLFFTPQECRFLDNLAANIQNLDHEYKRALAYTAICRTLTRKVPFGNFCHTRTMEYRLSPARVSRNPKLNEPIEPNFVEYIKQYNGAVFNNSKDNKAFNEDVLDLVPTVDVDLAYFDPPYFVVASNYHGFYHFLQTYVGYLRDVPLAHKTKMSPKKHSGFEKKSEIKSSFQELLEKSLHIPFWLISYNDRSILTLDEMAGLISPHRDVSIERYKHQHNNGGIGARKGSNEFLFVCKP